MQVKIFYRICDDVPSADELERELNAFLKELPFSDIVKTDVVAFPSSANRDAVAVFVWLRCDAK